ncbi:MurR/RpiR family transcriptional regulator [Labrenzia sp. 011]|uniref:MurR/RpiR family transcriptional regulator n=1 Tax=Labrenzia sp. 011 TaxID=2171494 RepID=UPI000D520B78|nr:MurR/RpiR family transcriptional regulator [Labrenzia sp. 011]PVB61429.1 SIS domain-containing protein [Labrenzia sp. 011]
MERPPLADAIIRSFDSYSAEVRKAARFVLDNPRDVALLSMREQARRAGVQPSTMMRLAKQLGFDGFEPVRDAYADAMRNPANSFERKARDQQRLQDLGGEQALAAKIVASVTRQLEALSAAEQLVRLSDAARLLAGARRVYCLGLRASHPIAWQLNYILSLVGDRSVLLDDLANTGSDRIRFAGPEDVLFAVTVMPYTQLTLDVVDYAHRQGVPVVALTDSPVSPLAKRATITIATTTESPSFYHTMTPAFALAEILAVLVAGQGDTETLDALRQVDSYHASLGTHAAERPFPVARPPKEVQ